MILLGLFVGWLLILTGFWFVGIPLVLLSIYLGVVGVK